MVQTSTLLSHRKSATHATPLLLYLLFKGPLSALEDGKLFAHIRKSKFKLSTLASYPLIVAAAGTGPAPFPAFTTERVRLKAMGKPVGEMPLFLAAGTWMKISSISPRLRKWRERRTVGFALLLHFPA